MKKYSATTNGFYIVGVHPVIPEDAVEITDEKHTQLLVDQSAGAVIMGDVGGNPVARFPPNPSATWDVAGWKIDLELWLNNAVRPQRDSKLAACDYKMMPDYPMDEAKREAWRTYRQALRDMPGQLATVADPIPWPKKPAA